MPGYMHPQVDQNCAGLTSLQPLSDLVSASWKQRAKLDTDNNGGDARGLPSVPLLHRHYISLMSYGRSHTHTHDARCCAALVKTQEAFYQRSVAARSACSLYVNGPLQSLVSVYGY